ncbi:hypothetical protein I316_03123 [Kwoniella heveanensis BCC8398]|uniref:Transcription factor domain-containing protein n=1 Tax=Kwoniella heveanensis BCC8398 TaxID=1296120 RepID=A0A1B9GVM7_9TREE|nr:hypothetical protein I316_03123 [Kwoniella heveanensis BCC8398]
MIPFLLSTTPVPKHPFVVLAAISYADMLPANAHGMVEESVLFAMTGAADQDVLIALYILSFASFTQSTATHAPLSPLQLISLAYRIGNDLGLEAKSEKALSGDTNGLIDPWASKRLEELAVRQVRTVEASRSFIRCLAMAETDDQWPDVSAIHAEWEAALVAMDKARDPDDWLHNITVTCLTFILSVRYFYLSQNIFTPISPALTAQQQAIAAVIFIRSANNLLVEFASIIPAEPTLPMSTVNTVIIALACSRRAHEITKHQLEHPIFDESLLETVEAYAEKLPGLPSRLMRESWRDLFHGTPNETPSADGVDGGFNFDFMDFQTFTGI